MVDPTKGTGSIQQIQSADKPSRAESQRREQSSGETRSADPLDQVTISSEAQSLAETAEATKTAQQTRLLLQEEPQAVLSRTGEGVDKLL